MTPSDTYTADSLRALVALMRELGVSHYEHQDATNSFKVTLGAAPVAAGVAVDEAIGGQDSAGPDGEATPEAYRKLPAAYRNLALYGNGKLPKLDG